MIELAFAALGIAAGTAMGFVPGFHINNLLPFFVIAPLSPPPLFIFIVALSIAYCFSSVFPSVLLGVPNADTALSVLPGHRLVMEGHALTALLFFFRGALLATLLSLPFLALFLTFLPAIYPYLRFAVPFLILAALFLMTVTDRKAAVLIVLLSAALGLMTFGYDVLLPLLSGFFGLSTLLISLKEDSVLPPQIIKPTRTSISKTAHASVLACFLSAFFSVLPGLSSAVVGLCGKVFGKLSEREFITLLGATNAAYMINSFFTLYLLGATRSGSAAALSGLMTRETIFFTTGLVLLSGAASFLICSSIAPRIVRVYKRLNYRLLTLMAISFLVSVNIIVGGFFGCLVLFASTSIGLLCNFLGARRTSCMAALIAPAASALLP